MINNKNKEISRGAIGEFYATIISMSDDEVEIFKQNNKSLIDRIVVQLNRSSKHKESK